MRERQCFVVGEGAGVVVFETARALPAPARHHPRGGRRGYAWTAMPSHHFALTGCAAAPKAMRLALAYARLEAEQ